ncbi:MAG: hypothetical protein IBX47_11975 [Desulfuromonadales bacterium]|nr:hypothetical protein [Desulfuromonadales bacterium]
MTKKTNQANYPDKQTVLERTPDSAVRAMIAHMDELGIETAFDRFDAQKPHCGFGLQGTW